MKILLGLLLTFSSQVLMAGCPKKEMLELIRMTKEELIETYCTNNDDYWHYQQATEGYKMLEDKYREAGNRESALEFSKQALLYAEVVVCSAGNNFNAFRVLQKIHGIEKQEDIKCE